MPLKWNFLRCLSARVKIHQIPHVSLKAHVNFLSNFASFFIVMTHNSSVNFKLIYFLIWIKGFHQNPNFETIKCSGDNLPKSSYVILQTTSQFFFQFCTTPQYHEIWLLSTFLAQTLCTLVKSLRSKCLRLLSTHVKIYQIHEVFWKDMSIPFQILHHSSLSWHITLLENLSSHIFYFRLKDSFRTPILRLLSALVKICQIPYVIFQTTSQFLHIFDHFSVLWNITPLYFSFSSSIIYFGQKEPIKV